MAQPGSWPGSRYSCAHNATTATIGLNMRQTIRKKAIGPSRLRNAPPRAWNTWMETPVAFTMNASMENTSGVNHITSSRYRGSSP